MHAGDRADWEALWGAYNGFYGRSGETALSADVVETTWTRLLDPETHVYGLLALRAGEPVGLAHLVFHLNLIQEEFTCYLQDLFTAPKARGLGVGKALIAEVSAFCRSQGVFDVYWHTHESNAAARRLYDGLAQNTGFIVYRQRIEPSLGPGGNDRDNR